ncbi:hypothetical protein [Catenibacterium mitsuokai]|uniref:hypothetical protein n=1 Tax=Catenibacterium mitsuokai TaxID=100886 RepID=UPI0022DFBB16|nr:hypothetical protein [Catenibacterium mitsuokai]
MINAEKYKDQLLKFVEENHDSLFGLDKNSEPISCTVSRCNNCQFGFKKNNYIEGYSCSAAKIKWLLSEYKEPVKLSRLEYEILKLAINKSCEYIARDSDGQLFVFMEKPHKGESFWKTDGYYYLLEMFSVLFQFVKWEDSTPTPIKEVLENCEVVEDAEE